MLYKPELAQDASKGATAINTGKGLKDDAATAFLFFFMALPSCF
jgi:hypothetical protein